MTRLTALELFGFKSFADRTRFEFPAGVTAVVGPNGSGKSNVVDAIKWVLGEQSVRSLRGRDMTDVIFAGSGGRRPLNAAEVSLIFDNADGSLPVTATQVQITRRVYRSGENEYLINGEASRLRDIRELFSGTGAATEAYSVIEQGRVDALLVASGRDRRAVFEEAAGITRFRARRTEALRRLERAEQNRQRLADIVGEVSSRLETVRQQATRARRWQHMTDRLRSLRLAAAASDLAEVDAATQRVETVLATARDALEKTEALATAAAENAATLAHAEEDLQPRLESARTGLTTEQARTAAAEASLALLWNRRREVAAEIRRIDTQYHEAGAARRAAERALSTAVSETDAIELEVTRLVERLTGCEQAAAGSHEHAARARQDVADCMASVEAAAHERHRLDAEFARANGRVHDAQRDTAACRSKLDATRQHVARLDESLATWKGALTTLTAGVQEIEEELESLDAANRERGTAVEAAWQALSGWQAKLEACRERGSMLDELIARQEGLSDAARRLLAEVASGVPGLTGPLGGMVDTDVDWAPLVDLVLGPLAQALVVGPLVDVVRWQGAWSSSDAARDILAAGGRIGFLTTDSVRRPAAYAIEGLPGVVGRFDRLIGIDASGDGATGDACGPSVAARLLGRVWVVDRLEAAVHLVPDAPPGTLFVTRSGESLSSDGALDIGQPAATGGLVARRSERRALEHRERELAGTAADVAARVERLQRERQDLAETIRQAQLRRRQAAERAAAARAELDRTSRELSAANDAVRLLESDLLAAERQVIEVVASRDAVRLTVDRAEHDVAEARRRLEAARTDIDTLDRSRTEVLEEIQSLRIARASLSERLGRARDGVAVRQADLNARSQELRALRCSREELDQRIAAVESDLLTAIAAHAEAAVAAERSTRMLAELSALGDTMATERRAAVAEAGEARDAAARLSERIHAHELEAGEARHRRARIAERIRDEYDLSIDDVLAGTHVPSDIGPQAEPSPSPSAGSTAASEPIPTDRAELDSEVETLRRRLATMGSVNLEALAEAEALTDRLTGLQTQLADVANAKQAIEELVARIDEESRRLLAATIETVRGHFCELFERLFGGGQADILVEQGVDLLEASVEIVSRPPGKEPRNISLLSGGEKTMTCVALLLAIFRSRPSPFCVLDEVDAALDEANVDRFAGVLRDFLSSTQFIVVTHSKKTMAAADTLYGITMEESGVSQRIAVRLEHAASASERAAKQAA